MPAATSLLMDFRLFFPVIRISDSAAAPFAPERRGRCKTVRPSLEGGERRKVDERRAEKHKKQLMMSGEGKEEREGRLTGRRRKGGKGGEHSAKNNSALTRFFAQTKKDS